MKILNHTGTNFEGFTDILKRFVPFAQKEIGFNRPPTINLVSDVKNGEDPMGKTAFYDPQNTEIVVFTDGRHPKDMLRSISHELVHHAQNCNGSLKGISMGEDGERVGGDLREMEVDANSRGNMCVRDFVDQQLHLEESKRRNRTMASEQKLRAAIRHIIEEAISPTEAALTALEAYQRLLELGDGKIPAGMSLADVGGPEAAEPGMTDAGRALSMRTDWSRGTKTPPEGEAEIAAIEVEVPGEEEVAAVADIAGLEEEVPEEELEVEDLEESMLRGLIGEARRRRARRQARLKRAKQGPYRETAPPAAAPEPKAEAKKEVLGKKKAPAAKKAQVTAPSVTQKPIKEWYREELFSKLIKEVASG